MGRSLKRPFPVAGIGASAGGLAAVTELISALPPRPGLALVIIQHLDPTHDSHLVELLRGHTGLRVVEADDGAPVEPNQIYVIRPNTDVAITDGRLSVTPRPAERRPHYPVDHFLRSLARTRGAQAIGVILSGTGSDGTRGLGEIKNAGGLTFAQDEATAQHTGMPVSASSSGAVDLVLPPREIAARLAELTRHPYLTSTAVAEPAETGAAKVEGDPDFKRILAALRTTSGVDFGEYRETTIRRRTARRMLLTGCQTPSAYADLLERDAEEAQAFYRDVLINVTSFFRDPGLFAALKQQIFPQILERAPANRPVRVWVPGCSTGQEAYSIAIALVETIEERRLRRQVQIFATDLGEAGSLDRAREGLYPESIDAEVSPERLQRFFIPEERRYRISKEIRSMCVFAQQNLTADPPFSRVDLVTCRNVLIYMSSALQERVVPVFHFALNPHGFLVLGMAETIGRFTDLFHLVDPEHKVYRRLEAPRQPVLPLTNPEWFTTARLRREETPPTARAQAQQDVDRMLLAKYAPPNVLVGPDFEVLQFRGRTADFLEAPSGQPTASILRMAREGLFMELQSALHEARDSGAPVTREDLRIVGAAESLEFTLHILPVPTPGTGCLLVVFEAKDWPSWGPRPIPLDDSPAGRDAAWLRQELRASKQYLEAIVDERESAVENLRTAHEEVLSSNEELQSTNEELETTKEELQSANEELTSVNEQFQRRNVELDALNDDLANFIASAELPMMTVDPDLRIRRLTPSAKVAFNVLPNDVGRPISDINTPLAVTELSGLVRRVIETGEPWEQDVTDRDGRWWVLRLQPFRTSDRRIDGATIVAVDIDLVKRSRELLEARDYALAIVQTVREPLVVLDEECRVGLANEAYFDLFGGTSDEVRDRLLWETGKGVWRDPELRGILAAACEGGSTIANLEIERNLSSRGVRKLVLNARRVMRTGRSSLLLLGIEDVTDTRLAESLRIDADTLRLLDRRKDEFLGILAHELRNPLAPMRFALELLRQAGEDPAVSAKARAVLERQFTHVVRIVDDLLDVSRITQGKVELRMEALELEAVVNAAVELSRPFLDAARHVLTISLPDEKVVLNADSVRMTQVLVNLLNNAAKFTPPAGHIWLIAETAGELGGPPSEVVIRVRDAGIGIAPEILPKIFDMFMQGDRSLERTRGGLGVGLTLVRNLVSMHGGTIVARSEGVGSGSEFEIRLPLDPAAHVTPASAAPVPVTATPLSILVADDSLDGREMLTHFLRKLGHTVETAEDGSAALARARRMKPDLVILDIGMPGMNGYQVAESLRRDGVTYALFALSGLGQDEDKVRAIAAGFDRHFTKPVDIDVLGRALAGIERQDD